MVAARRAPPGAECRWRGTTLSWEAGPQMSFRTWLRVFFFSIVIIPMVAVAFVLFKLTADSETGRVDAGIAAGMRNAFALYSEDASRATSALRAAARDGGLRTALLAGDERAAAARLGALLHPTRPWRRWRSTRRAASGSPRPARRTPSRRGPLRSAATTAGASGRWRCRSRTRTGSSATSKRSVQPRGEHLPRRPPARLDSARRPLGAGARHARRGRATSRGTARSTPAAAWTR